MEFEEDINPEILLALILFHLSLHFLKGEVTTIDPSFSLTHETIDCFDGIHLGIGIGHEDDIFFVFVDTHAQNSVLSEIDVLVVENLLLWVGVDWSEVAPDELGQEDPHEEIGGSEGGWGHFVGFQFFFDWFEILSQEGVSFVDWSEGIHGVTWEGTRQHVDKLEDGFKRFIDEMGKMVFDLLGFLDIEEIEAEMAQPVKIFFFVHLVIFNFLGFQTHVAADSTNVRSSPHVVVHFVEGLGVGSQPHVQQYWEFGFQLIADAIEEPVMGRQFSTVFVLDAEEKVHVSIHSSSNSIEHFRFWQFLVDKAGSECSSAVVGSSGGSFHSHLFFLLLPFRNGLGEGPSWQSVSWEISQIISGSDVLVALFLRGGKFLHDTLFCDVEIFFIDNAFFVFLRHGSKGIFLLIDDFIEDHL